MKKSGGEKFTDRYGVETAQAYKGDSEALKIPPATHFLYDPTAPTTFDPLRVEAIDRDGKMTTPIEVYTDPDTGTLWVLDGRGRTLDVREVNRRRRLDGRELVKPLLIPFNGDEKAAIARVREKNYHRRAPTSSGMALDLLALRNAGHTWEACAKTMHVETEDAEQWGRRLFPLAFCIEEVRVAIDAGTLPKGAAKKFGGTSLDGTKALGKKEQQKLLAEMLSGEPEEKETKTVSTKTRRRAREALESFNTVASNIAAAVLARLDGDENALAKWPELESIFEEASKPQPAGRPKKQPELLIETKTEKKGSNNATA